MVLPLPTSGWHDSWIVTVFSGAEEMPRHSSPTDCTTTMPPVCHRRPGDRNWARAVAQAAAQLSEAMLGHKVRREDGALLIDRLKRARNFYVDPSRLDARFETCPKDRPGGQGECCCRSGLRSAAADLAIAGLRSRHESGTAPQS